MLVELDLEKATDMAMQRESPPSQMNHRHRHQHLEGANEKGRVEVKVGSCSLSREDGNGNENEDEDEKVFVHLEREVAKCLLLSQRGKHDEALQGLKRAVLPQVEERVGRLQRDKEKSAHTNLNLNSNGHSHSGDEMEEEEKNKSEDFEAGRPSSGKGSQWSRLKAKAYCVYATVLRNKSASSTSTSTSSGGVNANVNANANGTEIDIDGRRHEGMEAMEAFEVALQADGDSAEVLLECGRACRSEAATVHKAVELHWRALRLYPGSATLKRELACSLNDLGTFFKNTAKDGELREDVVRVALNLIDAYLGNSSEEKDREGSKNHVVEADHEAEHQQQRQQQSPASASASASASVSALLDGNSGPTASPLYERMYRTALAIDGEYSPSWYNMGVAYGEKGEMENAARAYLKALEFCPEYTEALCNYGALLRTQGNLKGAVEAFEKSLRLCPNHNMIKANLAATLCELGAQVKSEGTLGCDRNSALYRASLREAIQIYERAMALEPKHPLVLYNLGVAYSENGERQKSIAMYELTITFSPECAEAWNNLGVLLRDSGNIERAIECYQTAGRVNPKFGQPLNNLGIVYASRGAVKDSLQSFQAAIAASPSYAEVYNNLGVLYRDIGEMQDCLAAYRKCMDLDPQNRSAGHNLLMGLNYVHSGEEETLCEAHREWGETFAKQYRDYLPDLKHVGRDTYRQLLASSSSECYQDESKVTFFEHHTKLSLTDKDNRFELTEKDSLVLMDPEKELTLGYISPDLFTHSVSYFAEAPLTHHRNVKVIVYNVTPAPDAKTDRLKRLCAASLGVNGDKNVLWRDVAHLSELNLAKLIRKDGVDILVELTGHTANNRLAAMAMRPAPIQATWIGYPNSTGLKEVDYRITDEITDPKDTKQTYVEKLERLPGCFLCYTPAIDAPQVEALPVLSTGVFTFGTFNALAKVTNEVVELWACILREVPNSRLLIKSKPFLCETGRQRTQALFQSHGIDLNRVDLVPLIKSNHGHLAVYHHVDLALDPFPYAGTTTTCEALYMGVPSIIPAWGGGHAQMVGASLLQNVFGHDHGHHHHHQNASSHSPVDMEANRNSNINSRFIARSKQEYVELAIYHSRHWNELSALRSSLREKMLSSPLCQAKPFVAQLESVYRKWWKTLCRDKEREREGVTRRERITKMNTSNVDVDDVNGSPNTVTGVTSEIQTAHNQRDHLLTASEENNVRENVKRICLEEPDCSSDCSSDQTSQLNC